MIIRPWVVWAVISLPLALCNVFIPPEHRPGVVDELQKIMLQYQNHILGSPPREDDLYCKCNEMGCDTEIIEVAGTNYSGICRVPKGGQCRTVEAFNEYGKLSEVHFECIEFERLIPLNQPLICVSREGHPRLRQFCCNNASLCNDAIIPPLSPRRRVIRRNLGILKVFVVLLAILTGLGFLALFVCLLWACNNKAKDTMRKYLIHLPFFNLVQHSPRVRRTHSSPQSVPETGPGTEAEVEAGAAGAESEAGAEAGTGNDAQDPLMGESSGHGFTTLTKRTMARQVVISNTIISRGRYGEVRLGDWKGEAVAVKIFNSRDEQSFYRESRIYMSNALKHPCVLRYIASDNKDAGVATQLLIITEYIPNGALYDYLGDHTVDKITGLRMIQSISSGLAYLHTEIPGLHNDSHKPAVAHRDMKSKNVLVKKDLSCVIADLGMAIFNLPDDTPCDKKFGTTRYMAPELFSDEEISFTMYVCADVYATALIIWEIVRRMDYKPGGSYPYMLPYFEHCSRDPTPDDMYDIIVTQGLRPKLDVSWDSDDALKILGRIMTECWNEHPLSRLPSLNIRIQVDRLVKIEEERLEALQARRRRYEPSVQFDNNVSYFRAGNNAQPPVPSIRVSDSDLPGPSQAGSSSDKHPLIGAQGSASSSSCSSPPGPSHVVMAQPRTRSGSRASNRTGKNPRPLSPLSEKE
uniref:receptor protein serine/threonine kinase n=1 Tax=Panagrellus redivivus TaxID=6233 RepID=A0A7E4VWW1_PANRE